MIEDYNDNNTSITNFQSLIFRLSNFSVIISLYA